MTAATSYGQMIRIRGRVHGDIRGDIRKAPRKASSASAVAAHRTKPVFTRIAAAMLIAAISWLGWSIVMPATQAQSATGPVAVVNYTVRPGDTLWSFADRVTPKNGNVAETVQELKELNNLDSVSLTPGQNLLVPER